MEDEEEYEDCSIYGHRDLSKSVLIHEKTRKVIEDLCRMSQEAALKRAHLDEYHLDDS